MASERAREPFFPAQLVWFDALAALAAGLATFGLFGLLQRLYGLPDAIIQFVGFVNLAYAAYGLSLALSARRSPLRVIALAWANLAWTPVCVALVIFHLGTATWLGLGMLLFEGAFVACLGLLELRYLSKLVR